MHTLWPVIFLLFPSTSLAVLVNVTIDDTLGDFENGRQIIYIPDGEWNVGPSCRACSATPKLEQNRIHDGTWHDGEANKISHDTNPQQVEQPLLAVVPFYGSAIYVYCILANTETSPNGNSDMTFLIDSQYAGEFVRQPSGDNTFEYNALVFHNQSLSHGNHTLTIQNGHIGGPKSLVILDYVVYSYENGLSALRPSSTHLQPQPTSAPASASPARPDDTNPPDVKSSGKIVGGVLGTLGVVLLGLVAFLWKRQRKPNGSIELSPPPPPPSKFRGAMSGSWIQTWWRKPRSETGSHFSFNPSLFVEPMMNRHNTVISRSHSRPPPVTTVLPIQPPPQRPDSTRPLQPNREVTPTPSLDPRNEERHPLSILQWQRQTQLEADATPPRFDATDRDLSSYYDFSSDGPEPLPPAQRPTPRRFTVVNN
ncbi:hypothetical protein FPV67DRAFT_314819 [Lyophyllum atratum]|nr:hypothetical protein FPV67DRAFT_314819 [Lyophyllum atratum]